MFRLRRNTTRETERFGDVVGDTLRWLITATAEEPKGMQRRSSDGQSDQEHGNKSTIDCDGEAESPESHADSSNTRAIKLDRPDYLDGVLMSSPRTARRLHRRNNTCRSYA